MNAEQLVNTVENDRAYHERMSNLAGLLRGFMDTVARSVAKSNAAWHDDPDADDHAAFHAPAEQQFPREVRDQAIKDLVELHLQRMAENDRLSAARE
jgi:hypothetical protein